MENPPIFNGKNHYKWPFSIAMLNYQRVFGWSTPMASPMASHFAPADDDQVLESAGYA
jgi:hypothetical protein